MFWAAQNDEAFESHGANGRSIGWIDGGWGSHAGGGAKRKASHHDAYSSQIVKDLVYLVYQFYVLI